jgi:isocitrate/isopropylmalate dehydrogenase
VAAVHGRLRVRHASHPYRAPGDINFIIVRENNGGEYSALGGIGYEDTPEEVVILNRRSANRGNWRRTAHCSDRAVLNHRSKLVRCFRL